MRVCVFGAGAIGGHLAARLASAGHDVIFVTTKATGLAAPAALVGRPAARKGLYSYP